MFLFREAFRRPFDEFFLFLVDEILDGVEAFLRLFLDDADALLGLLGDLLETLFRLFAGLGDDLLGMRLGT